MREIAHAAGWHGACFAAVIMRKPTFLLLSLSLSLSLTLAACASESDESDSDGEVIDILPGEPLPGLDEGKADGISITFSQFADEVGSRKSYETRRMFTSAADYRAFFGHSAPSAVNFTREWVLFYAIGSQPTQGYTAAIRSVSLSGNRLNVVTAKTSPGASCTPARGPVSPFVLVKFPRQNSGGLPVTYLRADTVVNCARIADCTVVACPVGSSCSVGLGGAVCTAGGSGTVSIPGSSTCLQTFCIDGLVCNDSSGRAVCEEAGQVVSFPVPQYRCGQIVCPNAMWCIDGATTSECKTPAQACKVCNLAKTTCKISSAHTVQCVPRTGPINN